MSRHITFLTKLFKDSKGKIVIWQAPNVPLVGWLLASALKYILPTGQGQLLVEYVSFGFIFTWAWLELIQGASYFRRALGAAVLVVSIHSML